MNAKAQLRYSHLLSEMTIPSVDKVEERQIEMTNNEFANFCKRGLLALEFLIHWVTEVEESARKAQPWYKKLFVKPQQSEIHTQMKSYVTKCSDSIEIFSEEPPTEVVAFSATFLEHVQFYINLAQVLSKVQSEIK